MYASSLQEVYGDHLPRVGRDISLRREILASHRAIAEAIERGDAPEAERITSEAMRDIIARFERAFPGFLDQPVDWQ
jgi:DNA-binding GntR family transcriptional regulator